MHSGGIANKFGQRYEDYWTVKQLLRLLREEVQSVRLESFRRDEENINLFVAYRDGSLSFQQCKKSTANWTITRLGSEGVIDAIRQHLQNDTLSRFEFVSNQEPTQLRRLTEAAGRFSIAAEFQAELETKQEKDAWSKWCQALRLSANSADAFNLLQRIEFAHFGDDPSTRRDVRSFVNLLIDGDPADIVLRLADFALENVGQRIHVDELRRFITQKTRFKLRELAHSSDIMPVLSRCREEYRNGVKPYLIDGQLITRPEAESILSRICQSGGPRLHFLHGHAGRGKSCVLYALIDLLESQSVLYLPIRLDQRLPKDTTKRFGESLGLPESPIHCLHAVGGGRATVLILDQLDALRWSPQHDPSAWAVFVALVHEAMRLSEVMHVVVACRTFDLEYDPSISAWKKERGESQPTSEYCLNELSEDVVRPIVERHGEKWPQLSSAQRAILCQPHLLKTWTKLSPTLRARATFRSATGLMREFWQGIREQLFSMGIVSTDTDGALDAIVGRLDEDGVLAVPETVIDRWPKIRDALHSLGVLVCGDETLRFTHQSYFDYLLAVTWVDRLHRESKSIHDWLRDRDDQSLLRRGQLRHILSVLRDETPKQFIAAVRAILSSTTVRFHLQHLTLQFLGHVDTPTEVEVNCVIDLLQDAEKRNCVVSEILTRRRHWFSALDAAGYWEACLRGDEDWKIETACWVLATVSGSEGNRVAELLAPYQDAPDPWPRRIRNVLPWQAHQDPPGVFTLRRKLLQSDSSVRPELWLTTDLARQKPIYFIDLLAGMCERSIDRRRHAADDAPSRESCGLWIPHHIESAVREAIQNEPGYFWRNLLPLVLAAVKCYPPSHPEWDEAYFDGDSIWQEELYRGKHSGGSPLPCFLTVAAAQWSGAAAAELIALEANTSRTVQQLIGTVRLRVPPTFADDAIQWLLNDARRFTLGHLGQERGWQLAFEIIQRHAPYCSAERYRELERLLLAYYPDKERKQYRHDLERYRGGGRYYRANTYGFIQHALLPALPNSRRSCRVTNALGQLLEKYKRTAEELEGGRESHGGAVRSPIASHKERLTDEAWLKLMGRKPDARKAGRIQFLSDAVIESTPEEFSRDLETQAARNPQRFAALALRVPLDADPCYWAAFLHGLRFVRSPEQTATDWKPATDEQCHAILMRIGYRAHSEVGRAWCRCAEARGDINWRPEVVQLITRYATEHPDPQADGTFVGEGTQDRLDIEAVNSVRGVAAHALRHMLFEDRDLYPAVKPTLARLIHDPVTSVRAAAIGMLQPVLNIDKEQAVTLFMEACEGASDDLLASGHAHDFVRFTLVTHGLLLEPLIARMVNSPAERVAKHGAAWAALTWLHTGRLANLVDSCVAGQLWQRQPVAEVFARNLEDERVAVKCREGLPTFFNDSEKHVRDSSALFLRKEIDWHISENRPLLLAFVASQAFIDDPTVFVSEFEGFSGDLRPLADILFHACDRMTDPAVIEGANHDQGWFFDTEKLAQALLRLYAQAEHSHSGLRRGCLDRWDSILRSGRYASSDLISTLDA